MTKQFIWAVVKRFLRAFAAGGLGSVVLLLTTQGGDILTFQDFSRWLYILAVAFITGGLMALEKLVRFDKSKLKSIGVIFIAITLGFTCSCTRRIAVVQPEGVEVVFDDRVVNLWSAQDEAAITTVKDMLPKLKEAERAEVIKEFIKIYEARIAAQERVTTAALQREQDAGSKWFEALKEILAFGAAVGVGAAVK